jgi:hypothetical protein
MRVDFQKTGLPCPKNSNPFSLIEKRLPRRGVIFPNKGKLARKLLGIILMIIAWIHRSVQLFKVNITIEDNFTPYRARNGLFEVTLLHKIEHSLCDRLRGIKVSQFPSLVDMGIPTGLEKLRQVRSCIKNGLWEFSGGRRLGNPE